MVRPVASKTRIAVVVLCEMLIGWLLWRHALPKYLVLAKFKVIRVPHVAEDYFALTIAVALQLVVFVFIRRSRATRVARR